MRNVATNIPKTCLKSCQSTISLLTSLLLIIYVMYVMDGAKEANNCSIKW